MQKLISLMLAVVMLAALVAGCGTSSSEPASSAPASSTPASSSEAEEVKNVNEYGWEVPEETITLTYFAAASTGQTQEESDTAMAVPHQFFLDEFNIDLNRIVFKQTDDGTERLNLMLASNDYAECIAQMPDASAELFISQGRALELTDLLNEHAPDLLEKYGNFINLLKTDDGKLYKLASRYGNTTDQRGMDFAIRYDYFQETGMEMYDSLETYYEVIKKVLEMHPTNIDGEKAYGLTSFTQSGYEYYTAPLSFFGFKNVDTGFLYKENDDGTISHWIDTEEGLTVSKYINRMYREGILDPDYISRGDEAYNFMQSGRAVGNIGLWWHVYVGCNNGMEDWCASEGIEYKPEMRMVNVSFAAGEDEPALISNNYIRVTRLILTDKCTEEQAVNWAKYWNWECSPVGVAVSSMGPPEGEHNLWWINDEGQVEIHDLYWYGGNADSGESMYGAEDANGAFGYWLQAPAYTPIDSDPSQGWAAPCKGANMWDPIVDPSAWDTSKVSPAKALEQEQIAKYYATSTWDQTVWTMSLAAEDDRLTIMQNCKDAIETGWAMIVQAATEEECVAEFENLKAKLHELGLDEVVAAQQEAYTKNNNRLNGIF